MEKLAKLLKEKKRSLFAAESCTAGLFTASLAGVPGISAALLGGVVCYDNSIKEKILGVSGETLSRSGAVSFEVCREMLEGALRISKGDCACAITGIAGPGGGTALKPVGTVFIGAASPEGQCCLHFRLEGSRIRIRRQSATLAAEILCALMEGREFSHPQMIAKQ